MRITRTIRLSAGILAGSAALAAAATPAGAATCSFDDSLRTLHVESAGDTNIGVIREGKALKMLSDADRPEPCPGPRTTAGPATIDNTERIEIGGTADHERFLVDESGGAFTGGFTPERSPDRSEVEILVNGRGDDDAFELTGRAGQDKIKVGADGQTMLDDDADVDLNLRFGVDHPMTYQLDAGGGDDFVSGRGGAPFAGPPPADLQLVVFGGPGADTLRDGLGAPQPGQLAPDNDFVGGGPGDDRLFVDDGIGNDQVDGGSGTDKAVADDIGDDIREVPDSFVRTEAVTFVPLPGQGGTGGPIALGRLRLSHPVRVVKAGGVGRVALSWITPQGWKRLQAVEIGLYDGGRLLGSAVVHPRTGRITGSGRIHRARGGHVGHHGKTVTATVGFRIPKALAGDGLRVGVTASDRRGHEQDVPDAGLLRVR